MIKIKKEYIINNLKKNIYFNESPLGGIMNIAMFKLCNLAKKNKIKVLLGGYGLDEILGGYDILNPNLINLKNKNYLIDGKILDNRHFLKKNIKPNTYYLKKVFFSR